MEDGFIKNYDLLKEVHRMDDLLGFDDIIESFSEKLHSISRSGIIALVGGLAGARVRCCTISREKEKARIMKFGWILTLGNFPIGKIYGKASSWNSLGKLIEKRSMMLEIKSMVKVTMT